MDGQVFSAIHQEKLPLANDKAVIDWAVKRVARSEEIHRRCISRFGIQATVGSSEQMGADFGITVSPSFGVQVNIWSWRRRPGAGKSFLRVVDKDRDARQK
jgi:hypothetical protein